MPMAFPSRGFRRTRERASGLLFAFGVDDLSTSLATGQTLTFDRDSSRTVFDSGGRVTTLVYDQVPWSARYNSTEAVWEPTYLPQVAATNLCLQSENFGTTWAAIGTPTRTAAAATCGDVSLDLIGDDAAGTLEGYSQAITFTGNAVKAVSLFLKAGTSTGCVVRLRDTTGSANRLLATITWASGVPTVTMTTGTNIGTTSCANGVYQFHFQTTSVTAANTNQIEVYPATTSALVTTNTGTIYAGGVQLENYEYPRSYIRTTTGTVSTVTDAMSVPITWGVQDMTVYGRLVRPRWASLTTFTGFKWVLSMSGGSPSFGVLFQGAGTHYTTAFCQSGTTVTADQPTPSGDVFEVCVQFTDLATAGKVRVDVGGGFSSYSATASTPVTAMPSTLYIGVNAGLTDCADTGIRRLTIASGARTLAQMRGLAV